MRHLVLLVIALWSGSAAAQTTSGLPGTPRIGLVLGGGGARGFAHIGVLQVLEENRIPVHAISGTSMGAVIGSLYASGQDAQDITQITQEIPWAHLFNDRIPRERMPFRRKRDQRDVLVDYRLAFNDGGLVLPQGVLRGQDLFLTLAQYLAPARGTGDFNQLAIPFRAVATDIETGAPIILDSGDIATAVFASMSVPGGLPPVERDGKLLVDGGVVDNLPIDVVRSLQVDRLIVVDVGTPLQTRDRLQSFVSVINQLQLLLGRENVDRQLQSLSPADVLISPELGNISATSFDRADDGIAVGRAAALAVIDDLRRYSLSEGEWAAYIAARDARMPNKAPVLEFVKIENESEIATRIIADMITARVGKPLDAPAMTDDLQNVYALGAFRSVRYNVGPSDHHQGVGATIITDPDPTAADWLQVGLGISTDFNRSTNLRLGIAYTDRNFLGTHFEWRTDVRIGSELLLETSFYREFAQTYLLPKATTRPFIEFTPYFNWEDSLLFEDGDALAQVRATRVGARFETGLVLSNWGELRVGLNYGRVDLDTLVGALGNRGDYIPGNNIFSDSALMGAFTIDTLDNVSFPTSGILGRLQVVDHAPWLGGDLDYTVFNADVWKPFTFGRTTIVASGEFGTTGNGRGQSLGDFRLGGFLHLSGLDEDALIGRHMMLGRAVVYHRLSEQGPIVNVPIYLGGSIEVGNTWTSADNISLSNLRPAGSLFAAADTPLGPFILAAGLTRGSGALYLILGRFF